MLSFWERQKLIHSIIVDIHALLMLTFILNRHRIYWSDGNSVKGADLDGVINFDVSLTQPAFGITLWQVRHFFT